MSVPIFFTHLKNITLCELILIQSMQFTYGTANKHFL